MNCNKTLLSIGVLAIVLVAGCSPNKKELPAVNDENCKEENLKKMEDKEARQELAGLCIRRGTAKTSPKQNW